MQTIWENKLGKRNHKVGIKKTICLQVRFEDKSLLTAESSFTDDLILDTEKYHENWQ